LVERLYADPPAPDVIMIGEPTFWRAAAGGRG
jgi:hypothetical protein